MAARERVKSSKPTRAVGVDLELPGSPAVVLELHMMPFSHDGLPSLMVKGL